MARTKLAITLGDPAGIGPEIVLKGIAAVAERPAEERPHLIVCGAPACLEAEARRLGLDVRLARYPDLPDWPAVLVAEATELREPVPVGRESAEGGRQA